MAAIIIGAITAVAGIVQQGEANRSAANSQNASLYSQAAQEQSNMALSMMQGTQGPAILPPSPFMSMMG